MRRTQQKMLAFTLQLLVQIFEGVKAGGIHRHYFAHPQNKYFGVLFFTIKHAFKLINRAKEKCSHHSVNHDALGYLLSNERVV